MNFKLIGLPQICFDAEGGGASGAASGTATTSAPSASSQEGASTVTGGPPSTTVTAPAAAQEGAAAGLPYRPEGLPDHLFGDSDQKTIDNLKNALDGYRRRDAETNVPDDAKAYSQFPTDVPAEISTHLETLKADPLFERVAAEAVKQRMSVPAFQALTQAFLSSAAEIGLLEPPIDVKAERDALVPEASRHLPEQQRYAAAERRMTENLAFIDQMVNIGKDKGGLDKEAGEFAKAMLGDSAKGHQFIEFLRSQRGGGAGPAMNLPSSSSANDPRAELARRAALPENTPNNPKFSKASHAQLQADYQRLLS